MAGCRQFLIFHLNIWYFCSFFFSQFGAPSKINVIEDYGRIAGGEPANITDFPYQLSMEFREGYHFEHTCGASVIDHSWLLTAAHCVDGKRRKSIRIRSGTSYRETNGELHEVLKIILHPQFIYGKKDFDVAVVKVTNPFRYSDTVKPIALARSTPAAGTSAVVTGWGAFEFGGEKFSQLQQLFVDVVDRSECASAYARIDDITASMLCAGDHQDGKGVCHSDSGGPLVAQGQLVGLVSWGRGCVVKGYPDVYTDVAYFRNWITSTIQMN